MREGGEMPSETQGPEGDSEGSVRVLRTSEVDERFEQGAAVYGRAWHVCAFKVWGWRVTRGGG